MRNQFAIGAVAISVFLSSAYTENADASAGAQCMGKITNGKPGGDHKFVLVVPSKKVDSFVALGFAKTNCRKRNVFETATKPQMCAVAARSNPAVDADFKNIYSVTPREICDL